MTDQMLKELLDEAAKRPDDFSARYVVELEMIRALRAINREINSFGLFVSMVARRLDDLRPSSSGSPSEREGD